MVERKAEKLAKQTAAENSFQTVALLWWDQWRSARSPRHADDVHKRLKADVFPAIGMRPVSEVQAPELLAMVKTIAARGALDIAKRALQTSSQVFRYAIAHGLAQINLHFCKPACLHGITFFHRLKNHARFTTFKVSGFMGQGHTPFLAFLCFYAHFASEGLRNALIGRFS